VSFDVNKLDGDHAYVIYGRLDCCVDVIVVCGGCSHMDRVHLKKFGDAVKDALIIAVYGEGQLGRVRVGVIGYIVTQESKGG